MVKQRIGVSIDEDVFYEIVRTGMNKNQQVSNTVNELLKIYFTSNPQYEKTINELTKEIKNLRLKHYTEVVKEVKDKIKEEKNQEDKEAIARNMVESIKRSGKLKDLI